ncbi:TOM1-like protein 2 [Grifola frondosa]|uniref:TOM1-like protein 2 n=1 Tax=Grifola frondosa TaxID=5627 RepID=A0A1C7MDE3_GRIFR|nr:TOM1-like protein 2 [Grifola frondosa]
MKRLFGRDKPKVVKVAPGSRVCQTFPAQQKIIQLWDFVSGNEAPLQPLRPTTLAVSHSPAIPIGPGVTPVSSPLPRAASPFGTTAPSPQPNSKSHHHHKDRDRDPPVLRKKAQNPVNALAAIRYHDRELIPRGEEGKARLLGTCEWSDKEKDRFRDKERKEDDPHAELTRMIGYLTATASEDWSLVLEVCERSSASEANAKEAVKALRREFKYAEPPAQLSAARLWAIMLRNSSELFIHQCTSRKFLDTLEDVISSSRTSPVVRERLLEVLGAAAYASGSSKEGGFRSLWRKLKPAEKPDEGVPFDTEDAMFYPPTPRHHPSNTSQAPSTEQLLQIIPQRPPATVLLNKPKVSSRNRVIPPEEDMRRLFQECKVGRGNASLLSESLAYAKPEDLKQKDIIREFYARCRASQELISAQIPWAFAGAERSREAAARKEDDAPELTTEEKLLAALLAANEELLEALRLYDDLERVGIERDAEERSKKETRMDRTRLRYDSTDNSFYLEPGHPSQGGASTSRSPSPSPSASPSPAPSLVVTPSNHGHHHPLPPIPGHQSNHHHPAPGSQGSIQSLAPPPPAPHGPRSPAHSTPRSRTPSPERGSLHHASRGSIDNTPSTARQEVGVRRLRTGSDDPSYLNDELKTPVRPSAKALGKRRVVEPIDNDRPFDPDDLFYEHTDESVRESDDLLDSDSEDGRQRPSWHQPTHYVYDAAAERTQQRIKEGRLAAAALVGGVH